MRRTADSLMPLLGWSSLKGTRVHHDISAQVEVHSVHMYTDVAKTADKPH